MTTTNDIPRGASRRSWGLYLGVGAFVAMALVWAYAFSGRLDDTPLDQVADPTWAAAANERCDVAMELIEALPVASTRESPVERAADIDAGTAALRAMLDEIEAIPLSADQDVVAEWLADYRTYVGDRDRYAQQLREGVDERFGVSISDNGDPIDRRLNGFATANNLGRCFVPQDV